MLTSAIFSYRYNDVDTRISESEQSTYDIYHDDYKLNTRPISWPTVLSILRTCENPTNFKIHLTATAQ